VLQKFKLFEYSENFWQVAILETLHIASKRFPIVSKGEKPQITGKTKTVAGLVKRYPLAIVYLTVAYVAALKNEVFDVYEMLNLKALSSRLLIRCAIASSFVFAVPFEL
jgi:hypothetical protein